MNLLEAREASVEPGSDYCFKIDPRLVEGIFSKFDPPRRWSHPIALRHVSETEVVSATRDLPRPTRMPGKARYSTPIPSNLFPETPLRDDNGREFAMVERRQLAEERLVAGRGKKEDMLRGKAVVLKRFDGGVKGEQEIPGEQDSFEVVVFDAADSYAQVEIEPEVRLRLEEEYRLLPARPQQDVAFQGIVHVSERPDGSDSAVFEFMPRNFFTNEQIDPKAAIIQFREAERYLTEPIMDYGYETPFSKLLTSSY